MCLHAPLPPLALFSRALVGHSYLQDAAGAGLSKLVDLAVAQGAVGTVLSTDSEDGAVFGFVTALPLRYLSREHQCVQVQSVLNTVGQRHVFFSMAVASLCLSSPNCGVR